MELLVFRHGIAEEPSQSPDGSDAARRLTDKGIERTREAAMGLAKIATQPEVILTSPLVRARQTADIAAEVLGAAVHVLSSLAHGPASAVVNDLRRRRQNVVMIVGHEPTLSRVVELLCTGNEPRGFVQMKKAGCACVQTPINETGLADSGALLWLATPKMLRAMA